MARRVGFGNKKNDGSEEFSAEVLKSRMDAAAEPIDSKPMGAGMRLFMIVFIGVWLIGWTGGIIFATFALFADSGFSKVFMFVWLVAAIIGWTFAFRTIGKLIRGEQISGAVKKR